MLTFRHIRTLTVAVAAVLAIQAAPAEAAEAAVKSDGKTSSTRKSQKSQKKTAGKRTSSNSSIAKTPPKHIDIAKLQPAQSLYRRHEAEPPASRSLSFFGSFSSGYRYDSGMLRAAEIASARAYAHSHGTCWRYVKDALISAGMVDSRPKTAYAKEAAWELTSDYGFKKLSVSDPFKAPLGSVLVYGGRGAGHIEFRTKTGFVSDFWNAKPSTRPLIGVFVKP
ncbi:MAG: hypothetical protein ABI318_06785 [Chthoniobacteraceae bacterium]